ncbi:sialate O-acetylesterase [Gelidibacter salicanalis]|uniref:sialate O-acetylesterase n=1 Tax=Gelidibacter salicanalis TaxID=291193 RepID=UPI0014794CAE|nr:sialate O-acetylesterase [Gelidibacter salicanalis]
MLHGQSNAWAIDYDNAYNDNNLPADAQWVRTIGAMHVYNKPAIYPEAENTDWYLASGKAPDIRGGVQLVGNGMVGVLGLNIGLNLVASEDIPIAIINGAGGGGAISAYQKTTPYNLDDAYGRLQYRLEASGLKHNIKAFIWNQGESNADDTVIAYKSALNQLFADFNTDFSFEKFYIIQTPPGCAAKNGHQNVREAQRQFAAAHTEVKIMTRHGFPINPITADGNYFLSDGCHYHAHGYEVLADWISNLAQHDFYNGSKDYQAPQLVRVTKRSAKSISIEFTKPVTVQSDLKVGETIYSAKDNLFAITSKKNIKILEIQTDSESSKKIILQLDRPLKIGETLTYILDDNYTNTTTPYRGPWLVDAQTGVGVVGFTSTIK